jgi:hypothetical protein
VERWRPQDDRPEIVHQTLFWRPGTGAAVLTIELPEVLGDLLGD